MLKYKELNIIVSPKKRWNTAICDDMGGSWEYHVKRSKSEKVKNHMWVFYSCVGYKTESNKWTNKTDRQKLLTQTTVWLSPEGRGTGEVGRGKEVKYMVTEDGLPLGSGHTAIYRWRTIGFYTWHLYNLINQCHPDKLKLKSIVSQSKFSFSSNYRKILVLLVLRHHCASEY